MGGGSGASYTGGAAYVGGGGGGGAKSAEKVANPFANLLGNRPKGDMNFRGPASDQIGAKGKNIFDLISQRYSAVNQSKRLLEYEEVK